MIDENENDAEGIIKILKYLHEYVPCHGDGDERVYASQGVVGDQLSVERGVNGHISLANGFTPEQRLMACILKWQIGMQETSFWRYFFWD